MQGRFQKRCDESLRGPKIFIVGVQMSSISSSTHDGFEDIPFHKADHRKHSDMHACIKLLKVFLVLWVLWMAFGVALHYKEFLTVAGSDYWSKAQMQDRARNECLRSAEKSPGECESITVDYVTEMQVGIMMWVFEKAFVQAPAVAIALVMFLFAIAVGVKRLLFRSS